MVFQIGKSKAYKIYCEGFGDSGEVFGEKRGVNVRDSGRIMRSSGLNYEIFGEV
jgi:hypothetical protein